MALASHRIVRQEVVCPICERVYEIEDNPYPPAIIRPVEHVPVILYEGPECDGCAL